MDLYKLSIFFHMRAVHFWAAAQKARARIDVQDFSLELRARNRYYRLYPQFLVREPGRRSQYLPRMADNVRGFVGWLPYFNKRWPTGSSKFAFKQFCAENDLPTPPIWRAPSAGLAEFLVKTDRSSFGTGMRGPFKAFEHGNAAHALPEDGYYERFIRGRILKAWYWEQRLCCLEVKEMPSVTGDGRSTLRELIARKQQPTAPDERAVYAEVAAYQGLNEHSVPAAGAAVLADFRYGSFLHPISLENANVLAPGEEPPLIRRLREFGPALWRGIPEELRPATLYTVDAIADAQDGLWLLEMNCNPATHPDVYGPMFESLFGKPSATERTIAAAAPVPADLVPPLGAPAPVPPVPLQPLATLS